MENKNDIFRIFNIVCTLKKKLYHGSMTDKNYYF
jgi:hypothetical protein